MKPVRKVCILEYTIKAGAGQTESMNEDEGRLPEIAVRVGIDFQPVAGRNVFDGLRHCWGVWNGSIWGARGERQSDASL